MAITAKMYGQFLKMALNKEIDYDSDTIKCMLVTSSYTPDQDAHYYKDVHVTGEANGTGYTAGGAVLTNKTVTYNASTNTIVFDADDVSWANSTVTARYAVIYDDTPSSNKPLIGFVDFGADASSSAGTFQITWDTNGIFNIVTS
jgi:hypothetical protein